MLPRSSYVVNSKLRLAYGIFPYGSRFSPGYTLFGDEVTIDPVTEYLHMANGMLTESPVVTKRKTEKPSPDPNFGRIELQAPPEWIDELDRAAAAVGLSRSAYIRLACNERMADDKRKRG